MSESSNITIRLGINGGTDSPLTYEQLDTNFLELKSVIDDYNDHINSENPHDAIFIYYDNENSSLSSSDIQSALDEVDANVVNMQNQITTKLDKTSFEDHIDSNTAHNAVDIVYDNSNSTIQQDDVNAAIDQLDANYNANDVLNKIKSVDGSGSGLDADTLDGIDSLGFDAAGAADTAVSDHEATNDHPLATTSAKGFLSGADKTKIDTVEDGATADQTDAEIKIAYESNADTNEFSDAEQTKLLGIEDGATADQTKADIDALNIDADTLDGINSLGFDAAGAADTAVSDHVALPDPHTQYLKESEYATDRNREDLLKQATLSLDFANNKYEVYEGPVNSLTQMPFNEVLDFTRASAATARTATGKIQGVLTDEQRLVGNREGLLIEEQRTNLVLWSEDFTQGAWAKDSITISPDAIFAPDASQTADRLAAGPANSRLRQTFTALGGEPIAVSYFIKKSNRALQRSQIYSSDLSQNKVIDVDFDSKTVFAPDASYRKIAELENGWHLVQVVFSAFDGVNTLFIRPSQTTVDEGAEVYVWGAQIEAGSTPSSYIKTEGAQVTRAADNCVRVLGDEFNAGELTLYYQSGTGINGFENSNTGLRLMFNISDDSSSYIGFVPDGRFKAGKSGSLFSAPNNWTDVQSGNPFKFAIAISYLTGGVNVAINGVISSYTDTAIPLVSNVLNVHTISSADPSGGSYANDTIKDFRVFPAALSEAELITLTGG